MREKGAHRFAPPPGVLPGIGFDNRADATVPLHLSGLNVQNDQLVPAFMIRRQNGIVDLLRTDCLLGQGCHQPALMNRKIQQVPDDVIPARVDQNFGCDVVLLHGGLDLSREFRFYPETIIPVKNTITLSQIPSFRGIPPVEAGSESTKMDQSGSSALSELRVFAFSTFL